MQSNKSNFSSVETEVQLVAAKTVKALRRETRRWPALLALVAIGIAYTILSDRLTVGPGWLLFPVLAVLVVPAIIVRLKGNHRLNHYLLIAVCGVVTVAEVASISLLLLSLPDKSIPAVSLLRDAALLWGSNVVVFALWYWQLDGGGPYQRSHEACTDYRQQAELLFPQLTLTDQRAEFREWRPGFVDYLFVAFNTSTAFSPTDTPVLSSRLKLLSIAQSTLSLITLATLAARAISFTGMTRLIIFWARSNSQS